MFRFNGIGLGFAGVSTPDREGNCTATKWFTVFYLPVIPLSRHKIKPIEFRGNSMSYQILSNENMNFREVLTTYFYGWILFPALILIPFGLLAFMGTPEFNAIFPMPKWAPFVFIALAIVWLAISVWKLKDWDQDRWIQKSSQPRP